MRILRIIASVDPKQGGPVEGMTRTAAVMAEWGHETEVLSLDAPGAFDCGFPLHGMGPVARKYGYTPRLRQWMAAHARRFDAAVVHGFWNHASVGGGWGAAREGLPYVVFPHGMMDPWFREAQPRKHVAKQLLWWAAQGRVLARAREVLFTSDEERLLAEGVFRGPGYVARTIAYGAAEAPAGIAAAEGPPYLLFLSRVHPKKGCDLLIEAFAKAPEHLHLVVAGPDEVGMQAALEARVRELGLGGRVRFAGMVRGEEKWRLLAGAEALVLPSHQENFGIVVAEALGCGTPVLISDKVNIWREVTAAGAGIVAPDSLAGVEVLLARWAGLDTAARTRMRAAARACFEANFRVERAARALLEALERAAGAGR